MESHRQRKLHGDWLNVDQAENQMKLLFVFDFILRGFVANLMDPLLSLVGFEIQAQLWSPVEPAPRIYQATLS